MNSCKLGTLDDRDVSMQAHQLLKKKITTLVGDVDSREGYAHVKTEYIWEVSVYSAKFCCEIRTALKNSHFKEKVLQQLTYKVFRSL